MLAALLVLATLTSRGEFIERSVTVDGTVHRFQVWVPAGYDSSRRWPAILFLHGAGERGSDNRRQIEVGLGPALRDGAVTVPALVVFPQCPDPGYWAGPERKIAMAALEAVEQEFAIDRSRISVTGLSMGGTGTWILAAEHPERFAAIAPVCGWVSAPPPFRVIDDPPAWLWDAPDRFDAVAERVDHLPTWIFHGGQDTTVLPEESRQMIARLGVNAAYTEFPEANHNSWDPAYRTTGVIAWLVRQVRKR